MQNMNWNYPTNVWFGVDRSKEIQEACDTLGIKNPLIVTDPGLLQTSIIDEIKKVDYALLDATFYDEKEINYRDISEIPHPFVIESLELFKNLKLKEKKKIYFIHLNHTNPLLHSDSDEYKNLISKGYNVANEGLELKL